MKLTNDYSRITASLPQSRHVFLGVDVNSMPYPLKTAFDLTGLTPIKDKISVDQAVAAFQNHAESLEDAIGRTPDDLIRDLNQFLAGIDRVRSTRQSSFKRSWWIHPLGRILDAGDDHERFMRGERELFTGVTDTREAVARGWVRVGYYGWEFNLNVPPEFSSPQLESAQTIYMNLPRKPPVYIIASDYAVWFDDEGFLKLHDPAQIQARGLRGRPEPKSSWSYS